jgi:hypothetical protein
MNVIIEIADLSILLFADDRTILTVIIKIGIQNGYYRTALAI